MNLAKVSANGQITVPIEIRRALQLKEGDKILFYQNKSGEVTINNASANALFKVQNAMVSAADEAGLSSEEDLQLLVDEIRYGKRN